MVDKKYQEYTSSKLIWVKDYPAHWDLTRVKYEAYVKARVGWHGLTSNDFTDVGPYLVTGSDFKGSTIKWEDCYHCDLKRYEQDPYIQLKNGDLLLTKDGTIGKVALVDGLKDDDKATLNSGVFVVRPLSNNFTTRFYYWLLESRVFKDFVDYYASGSTIIHLYQATFVNFSYASPPIDEQEKIASFLDYETAKIDTLIEKQQRLIELLTEKRQAVISHAVTKGLNPDVPMKDSGVEWLGEVPEHWVVTSLSKIFNIKAGGDLQKNIYSEVKTTEHIYPIYTNANDAKAVYGYTKKSNYSANSITVSGRGDVGFAVYRDHNFDAIIRLLVLTPNLNFEVDGRYFSYFINEVIDFNEQSSAVGQLSTLQIAPYKAYVPPYEEQVIIANHLDKQSESIELLINKAKQAIQLMQERRTALISAAVTGKIDVRDLVKPE